jgi:T1SS-143 domain-containing protein
MNVRVQVAQATLDQSSAPSQPRIIKIEKPQGSQAITVHLDGATRLDLSDISDERVTFVRVGERLIVLFDNQSTVTIEPFFDSAGAPIGAISIELSGDRVVSGGDFAALFPITTDQSVLPAAGDASGPLAGANFTDPTVDPLSTGTPLDLLGNTDDAGAAAGTARAGNTKPVIGTPGIGNADDEGLSEGLIGGPGDAPGEAASVTGSLDIDFGLNLPATLIFAAAQPSLSGITSGGQPVAYVLTTLGGLPAIVGYIAGSDPTIAANQVYTITLDTGGAGSFTFTLLQPFDHPITGTEDSISLSISFTVMDSDGDTASGAFTVIVNDDSAVIDPDAVSALVSALEPLDGASTVFTGGSLGISWGADRANNHPDGGVDPAGAPATGGAGDRSVVLTAVSYSGSDASGGEARAFTSLFSNGAEVHVVLSADGTTLIGYTGDTPPTLPTGQTPPDNLVFVATVTDDDADGGYAVTLYQQLDHLATVAIPDFPSTTDHFSSVDLTFSFVATDADGDPVASTFTVTIDDTTPVFDPLSVENGSIDEETIPTVAGNPGDSYGDGGDLAPDPGSDAGNARAISGFLGIDWKADVGNAGFADRSLAFRGIDESGPDPVVARDADGNALTSGHQAVFYHVTTGPDGQALLIAYTGDDPSDSGHWVFTVGLDDTSTTYRFELFKPLDHSPEAGAGTEDDIVLDFGFTAIDADGDPVDGQFTVTIDDDAPVQNVEKARGKVDEDDLDNYCPLAHALGWPVEGSHGTSPDADTTWSGAAATSGSLAGLVDFGADGAAAGGGFSFAFDDNAAASAAIAALGLDSKGEDIDTARLIGDWLIAGTGDRIVFALKVEDDGSYRFVLFDQLDHPVGDDPATDAPEAAQDRIRIDLSSFIAAADGDGDTIVLDAGSFVIRVVDDVPKAIGHEHHSVAENDLADLNPLYPVLFNFWQGSLGTSPYDGAGDGSITGLFGTVPVWGTLADNIKGGADERGEFHLVSEQRAGELLATLGVGGGALYSHGDAITDARYVHLDGIGDVMGFFASDGRLVFGLYVGENGLYNFRLFDQIDHPLTDDPSTPAIETAYADRIDIDLSQFVTFTDYDGDTINLGSGRFVITVDDDVPVVVGSEHHTVHENDLANFNPLYPAVFDFWQGSVGTSPYDGDTEDGITGLLGTVPVWGTLADNILGGADEFGEFHLVSEQKAEALLAGLGPDGYLTSQGDAINDARMIAIDGIGDVLGFFASDGRLVFGLYLNEIGIYNFRLFDQIDHPVGDDPNTLALEAVADTVEIDLSGFVTYTDYDGDTVGLDDGMFVIGVVDDVPQVIGSLTVTLDEADLSNFNVLWTPALFVILPWSSIQGSTGTEPQNADPVLGTASQQGELNHLIGPDIVAGGADEAGRFGLVSEQRAETILAGMNWSSKGDKIDDVVILDLGTAGAVMGFFAGDRLVFSLTLLDIGGDSLRLSGYDLRLFDQIDHVGAGNGDVISLDLSGFVTFTDFDGDTIDLGTGTFVLDIVDDAPIASGTTVTGTVEEEHNQLSAGDLTHGNEDEDDANGLDLDAGPDVIFNPFVYLTSHVSIGDLKSLVATGADEGGTFSLNVDISGAVRTAGAAPAAVTSKGDAVLFDFADGKVVGYVDVDHSGGYGGGDRLVFTLTDTGDGFYTFTLYDQIDHTYGDGIEDILTLNLGPAITYTDRDGDSVTLTAGLDIQVIDDTPVASISGNGYVVVDETVAGSASDNGGNNGDEAGHSDPFGNRTLIGFNTGTPFSDTSSVGADEGGSRSYALVLGSAASGLVDAVTKEAITLTVDGDGHVVGASATGGVAFMIGIDAATGLVTVAQYRAVAHNDSADADESGTSAATIVGGAVSVAVTITDFDGDQDTATTDLGSHIRFEDDGAVITAVETKGLAMNWPSEVSVAGDIAVSYGSDGFGALKITGWPTIQGVSTTLSADGHTLEASYGGSPLYTLTIDPTQGADGYTFVLHQPWPETPAQQISIASSQFVEAGAGDYTYGDVTFVGINPYNGGFGVGENVLTYNTNEIELSEGFTAQFARAMDKVTFDLSVLADVNVIFVGLVQGTVTVTWTASNGAQTETGTVVYDSNGVATLAIDPSIDFTSLQIAVTTSDTIPGARHIKVTGLTGTTAAIAADDQDLQFQVTATDGDGDANAHAITVHLEAVPVLTVTDTSVDEKGLPPRGLEPSGSGENADANPGNDSDASEAGTGTIKIASTDGLAEVRFTNAAAVTVTVTLAQLLAASAAPHLVFDDATGKLEVTGYDSATGTVTYRYTLQDNVDHTVAGADSQHFSVVAVDPDGYASVPADFTVTIVDDAPKGPVVTANPVGGGDTATLIHDETAGLQGWNDGNPPDGPGTGGPDNDAAGDATAEQDVAGPLAVFAEVPGAGTAIGYAQRVGAVSVAVDYGADGQNPSGTTLALTTAAGATFAGEATNLFDTATGHRIFLYTDSDFGFVLGRVGTSDTVAGAAPGGAIAFAIALGDDGTLSLAQYRALVDNPATIDDRDDAVTLGGPANGAILYATATSTDGDGDVRSSTPSQLTIRFDDDGPTAVEDDPVTFDEDTGVHSGNVMTNDVVGADGATLTKVSFDQGATWEVIATDGADIGGGDFQFTLAGIGVYTFDAQGNWSFTAAPDFAGTTGFAYIITDGDGDDSDPDLAIDNELTINVTPVADAPTPVSDTIAVTEDATAAATTRLTGVLGNDGDPDAGEAATLVVSGVMAGTQGTATAVVAGPATIVHGIYGDLSIKADGTYSYTPNNAAAQALPLGAPASDVFTYTAQDTTGATATATLTFNITGANDTPAAVMDFVTMAEDDGPTAFDVVHNDKIDPDDGAPNNVTIGSIIVNGGAAYGITAADVEVSLAGNNIQVELTGADWDKLRAYTNPVSIQVFYALHGDQPNDYLYGGNQLYISVGGVNDAPTMSAVTDEIADTATKQAGTAVATGNVLVDGSASDIDTDPFGLATVKGSGDAVALTVTPSGVVAHGTYGTLLIASDGSYTYTANAAFDALTATQSVTDVFDVVVKDVYNGSVASTLTFDITGTNDIPVLSATLAGVSYVDTAADDAFDAWAGTLSATDPDTGDSKTYGVAGGITDSYVVGAGTYDVATVGTYGTLYVNSVSGAYIFVPNDDAIEGLTSTAQETFTLTVTDAAGATGSRTFTVDLTGANDAPTLTATPAGKTYFDTSADDTFAPATGALSSSDRDDGDSATYGLADGVADTYTVGGVGYDLAKAGTYGTFYLDSASGAYTYVPNDGAIEALTSHVSESFTMTVTDQGGLGSSKVYTVDLVGANDQPQAVMDTGSMSEDDAATTFAVIGNDKLDRDAGSADNVTLGLVRVDNLNGSGSTMWVNAEGSGLFTITVTPQNEIRIELVASAWDKLANSATATIAVGYHLHGNGADASYNQLQVTVHGVNDAPVLADTALVMSVAEDSGLPTGAVGVAVSSVADPVGGSLGNVADPDASANYPPGIVITGFNAAAGTLYWSNDGGNFWQAVTSLGSNALYLSPTDRIYFKPAANFSGTIDDAITFHASDRSAGFQGLAPAPSSFGGTTPYSVDTDTVALTVTPVADPAVIGGTDTGSVTEDAVAPASIVASGDLTLIEPDPGENAFVVQTDTVGDNGYGHFALTARGHWTYALDNASAQVQALGNGETATDTFTVASVDGTTSTVTVTIHGTNDAPVLTVGGEIGDDFSGGYLGGIGLPYIWTSGWTETDDDGAPNGGDITHETDYTFNQYIELTDTDDASSSIARALDLSGATSATLTFDFQRVQLESADDRVIVEVSSDGVNFTQIGVIGGGAFDDAAFQTASFDISAYASATTTIRFTATNGLDYGGGDFDRVRIDNVNVAYSGPATFTEGGGAIAIVAGADVLDIDDANLRSATVVLANAQAGDELRLFGTNLAAGTSGSLFGMFSYTATLAAGALTVTFTGNTAKANWEFLLESLTFRNTSNQPSTVDRHFDISVGDGDASSSVAQVTAKVVATNDAPVITSNDGGEAASVTIDENTTAVTAVTSTDIDGGAPVYSILNTADTDFAKFQIDASTGALSFVSAPDFENPQDVGGTAGDNVYVVDVQVSDGHGGVDTQSISVTVADVQEVATDIHLADLAASGDGFKIIGQNAADSAGQSVSTAGDVNGDGYDDVIVGANLNNAGGTGAGAAYVVYGGPNTALVNGLVDLDTVALGTGGFKIVGQNAGDWAGIRVAAAGDVNGDGYADVLVGASSGSNDTAYVIFGGANSALANGVIDLDTVATGQGGFKITGEPAHDGLGRSLGAAGDVNGDGYADFILGVIGNDASGAYTGAAYVVYGGPNAAPAGGVLDLAAIAAGTGGFKIVGENAFDQSGSNKVASAGDVNADGYDDLIIGANGNDAGGADGGAAYVVYGGPNVALVNGTINLDTVATGVGGFKIIAEGAGDAVGVTVDSAGDINGDGIDDLIVGAYHDDTNGAYAGGAYVVYGGSNPALSGGTLSLATIAVGQGGFKIVGESPSDNAGFWVAAAGDVNGDGFADVIVGAGGNDAGGDEAGAAYVIYGGANGAIVNGVLDLGVVASGIGGFKVIGEAAVDSAGGSVSSAGDVNGDGFDDVIIGAKLNDTAGDGAGAAYVIYGGQGLPNNRASYIAGTDTGTMTEDGTTVGGSLTVTKADHTAGTFAAETLTGSHGSFSLQADGTWTYALNSGDAAVQGLNAGQSLTEHFKVTSADGTAIDTVTVTVDGVNDAPTADTWINAALSMNEDGSPISLAGGPVAIGDVDNAVLSATLAVRADEGTLIGAGSPTTANGVLFYTLSGTSAYLSGAIAAVHFSPAHDFSGEAAVSVTIGDGSAQTSGQIDITVNPVNDDPTLTGLNSSVTFLENAVNAAPQIIDANVDVGDIDSANFDAGTVRVSGFIAGEDTIGISNQGVGSGQIGVSGATVTYGGTVIGAFTGGSGANDLVVTFNTNATPAAVDALMQNLTYANASDTPTADRTLTISVTDGDGGSVSATTAVSVTAEPEPQPVAAASNDSINPIPNGWAVYSENGHIYKVSNADTSWSQAKSDAATLISGTSYLATITSVGENAFIDGLSSNRLYLGGSDDAGQGTSEGVWKWITGPEAGLNFWNGGSSGSAAPGSYTNWDDSPQQQPSNADGSGNAENFLLLNDEGHWNDTTNNDIGLSAGYVAEAGGLNGDAYAAITEDAAFSFSQSWLLANDADAPASILSVSATSSKGASVGYDAQTGMVTYDASGSATLQALAHGETTTDTFTYTIDDGHGGTSTATVTVSVSGVYDAPTIANTGFESPGVGAGYVYNPSGYAWTFSGTAGNGSGLEGNGSAFAAPNAPGGTQAAFVQNVGTIQQSFTMEAGTYTLALSAAGRALYDGANPIKVYLDNVEIGSFTPAVNVFGQVAISFTVATDGTHVLKFAGQNTTGDATTFIDNIAITCVNDPIILDLDNDGYAFSGLAQGARFDIDGDGVKDHVAWNTSGDGILAIDLDGDGAITSGKELFTPDFAGGQFASGSEALASLDANGDGILDGRDAAFASLLVWKDANADGISEADELTSLADNGVVSIDVATTVPVEAAVDGQQIIGEGTFTRSDGTSGGFVEVALETAYSHASNQSGTDGDDILLAAKGDTLVGGAGADHFRFNASTDGLDSILDFNSGDGDLIEILGSAFGGLSAGSVDGAMFEQVSGNVEASAKILVFDASSDTLYWNAGGQAAVALAHLENGHDVTAADLRIV